MSEQSEKIMTENQEPMYEQCFYGNEKFVGNIFGKHKENVRNFCRSLNSNLDCKVSVKWIKNRNSGFWSVRSTNQKAIENTISWLIDREIENWHILAKCQVRTMKKL